MGQEPTKQNGIGRIADPQPDDHGRILTAQAALRKVLVLGQDRHVVLQGVLPNDGVPGFPQPDFPHGYRMASSLAQGPGQRGRNLSVNKELHAACSTA